MVVHFISSITRCNSSGMPGIGARETSMALSRPFRTTMLNAPKRESLRNGVYFYYVHSAATALEMMAAGDTGLRNQASDVMDVPTLE